MHMKAQGQYVSRSLSFKGADFKIVNSVLPPGFNELYNSSVELWTSISEEIEENDYDSSLTRLMWNFHQRFFASLCMSAKVDAVVELAKTALGEGKCVIIGLQSTGESVATTKNARGDDELASTADGIVRSFLVNHCVKWGMDIKKRDHFLCQLHKLQHALPGNPLDEIIDQLGGPDKVAEMTGRQHRYIRESSGNFKYVARKKDSCSHLSVNTIERQNFQDGKKLVAVISQAASTGISLQADSRVQNRRRRVHITLQLAWSAEKAVQQLGRSHRSNQISAPEYSLVISPIAGEKRFASAVANRYHTQFIIFPLSSYDFYVLSNVLQAGIARGTHSRRSTSIRQF
jgi:hypothetical protein